MISVVTAVLCGLQDPDLAAVRAAEARRVAVVEHCAAAVCSVMGMNEPGGGSGVIFDPAGFVLTNYHVVGEPDKDYKAIEPAGMSPEDLAKWRAENLPRGTQNYKNKKVGLPDGRLYEGVVLGVDPGSDLAVVRLVPKEPGQTWPYCKFGDSDALLAGETVFAMGNPFLLATDFTPTVTFGIVSGLHRYQEGQGQRMLVYPDCIQVDAPVNPGNSGGPLFNEAGGIVGINGRISIGDRGRVNVGVGFAIASNQIKNFLGDLMAGRHAEHGTLDMSAWFMNSGTGTEHKRGVYVQQMFRDSVVADAGVGLGDEITWFNGTEVRSANQLATLVGVLPAHTWVTLGYKPKIGEGSFGSERRITVRMAVLDTGSSVDGYYDSGSRIASRSDRLLASRAVRARWTPSGSGNQTVRWSVTGPDGAITTGNGGQDRLRLEIGALTLVSTREGAFAIEGGKARDCTAEEAALLDRHRRCNPFLWPIGTAGAWLGEAELHGGVNVLGAPGLRFLLPGDGDCEAWLSMAGQPLGFAMRDPVRRARVEVHQRGDQIRVIVDGKLEEGWKAPSFDAADLDDAWFRRPQ
ncbi:MAG: trypsin-like peptidase domain-containing protein [Planctomycetota bacterium]